MLGQDALQMGDPNGERHVAEAKQDDTSVGESVAEDQIAEVLVVGQDDAPLPMSNRQDVAVGQRMRVVVADGGDVVILALEVRREPKGESFIEEERQSVGAAAVSLRAAVWCTSAWAYSRQAFTSAIVSRG